MQELGAELTELYADGRPLLVGVLTGAFVFMADLVRAMPIELDVEFMAVSSYGAATETSGVVRILKDLDTSIEGRDVLIVEDIIDSGLTLTYLMDVSAASQSAHSCASCAVRQEIARTARQSPVDYLGFTIPDEFVVGYGLDARKRFRNLPCLAVFRTE